LVCIKIIYSFLVFFFSLIYVFVLKEWLKIIGLKLYVQIYRTFVSCATSVSLRVIQESNFCLQWRISALYAFSIYIWHWLNREHMCVQLNARLGMSMWKLCCLAPIITIYWKYHYPSYWPGRCEPPMILL
jgi:hypothetical protein